MLVALLLLFANPPVACEPVWQKAWKAFLDRELKGSAPDKTPRVPNAVELIHKAFLTECASFTPQTMKCARGEQRERVVLEMRKAMQGEKASASAIAAAEARYRASWTVLECHDVTVAIERAGERAGADAGL